MIGIWYGAPASGHTCGIPLPRRSRLSGAPGAAGLNGKRPHLQRLASRRKYMRSPSRRNAVANRRPAEAPGYDAGAARVKRWSGKVTDLRSSTQSHMTVQSRRGRQAEPPDKTRARRILRGLTAVPLAAVMEYGLQSPTDA